ncbi:MAG: IS3 family transposase [Sphingomonadales bacterium]
MKRKRSPSREALDAPILDRIRLIKSEHPLWGYRRIWAYMRYRDTVVIGKNRIYRLMKEHHLLVSKNDRLKAKRYSTRPKPRANVPNQYWGTDMTKVKIHDWGWVYVHIVIDWYTKEIIGHYTSLTSKTSDWLEALHIAVNTRYPDGIFSKRGKPKLISDNGCQPTSEAYMKACSQLKIKQIFTTWNNPKGNADTERFFRTLKEDLVWTHDWAIPFEFQQDLDHWIIDYNTDFPHQSLAYKTPAQAMYSFINRKHIKEVLKHRKVSLILR